MRLSSLSPFAIGDGGLESGCGVRQISCPQINSIAGTDRGPFTGYRLVPKSGGYGVATYRLRGARIRGLGLSRLERRLRERLAGQAPYKGCPNPDDTRLDRGACRPTNTNREVKVAFIRKVCPIVLVRVGHVGGESERPWGDAVADGLRGIGVTELWLAAQ